MLSTEMEITEGEIHQILSNSRRRRVLRYLSENGGISSLQDLSQQVAEAEAGESPPSENARKAVYVALHQTHLPTLDDKGLIAYDRPSKQVELLDAGRDLYQYMEMIATHGITRATFYRNLSVVALVTIIAAMIGVPVISWIAPIKWATLFLAVFVALTVYQFWKRRPIYVRRLFRKPPQLSRLL
jgi:hypothetical protein